MAPWILLRGLTREARHWGAFPEALRAALDGARVVALDLPGNGALHAARTPATIDGIAERCRDEARALGIVPPLGLIGLSLGGMVAASWASHDPDGIEAYVMINTSMRPFGSWRQRLRPRALAALATAAFAPMAPRQRESTILAWTSGEPARHAACIEPWTHYRCEHPVSAANTLRQIAAAARYRAPSPPKAPGLLLASRRDRLVDPACSIALSHAWDLPLALHPAAGHDLPLDDPSWVAAQVRAWIASLRR